MRFTPNLIYLKLFYLFRNVSNRGQRGPLDRVRQHLKLLTGTAVKGSVGSVNVFTMHVLWVLFEFCAFTV